MHGWRLSLLFAILLMLPSLLSAGLPLMKDTWKLSDSEEEGGTASSTAISPPPWPAIDGAASCFNKKRRELLVFGGFLAGYEKISPYVQIYSIATKSWRLGPKLPASTAQTTHMGVACTEDVVFLAGGQKHAPPPPSPTCSDDKNSNNNRNNNAAAIADISISGEVVAYLLTSERFVLLPSLPAPRFAPAAGVIDGKLHVWAGSSVDKKSSSVLDRDGFDDARSRYVSANANEHWHLRLPSNFFDIIAAVAGASNANANNAAAAIRAASASVWELVGMVPLRGTHSVAVSHNNALFWTAIAQGSALVSSSEVVGTSNINSNCKLIPAIHGRYANVSYLFRYTKQNGWEQLSTEMVVPVSSSGVVLMGSQLLLVGGYSNLPSISAQPVPTPHVQYVNLAAVWPVWRILPQLQQSYTHRSYVWVDRHPVIGQVRVYSAGYEVVDGKQTFIVQHLDLELFDNHANELVPRHSFGGKFFHCLKNFPASEWTHSKNNANKDMIITRANPAYQEARMGWNTGKEQTSFPMAVLRPRTVPQIQQAVRCASALRIAVCVRNGGHSFESSSNCGGGLGGVVVDVSALKSFSVAFNRTVAVLGAGLTLGQVFDALADKQLSLPSGHCATVGITGLMLNGGGQGMQSRLYGRTADRLVDFSMVTVNGEFIPQVSKTYPELFWMAKGGGAGKGNAFPGVVTSWQMRPTPLPASAAYMVANYPKIKCARLLNVWQTTVKRTRKEYCGMTIEAWLIYAGEDVQYCSIRFHYIGSATAAQRLKKIVQEDLRVLDALGEPKEPPVYQQRSMLEHQAMVAGVGSAANISRVDIGWDRKLKWKGRSVVLPDLLPMKALEEIVGSFFSPVPPFRYMEFKPLGCKLLSPSTFSTGAPDIKSPFPISSSAADDSPFVHAKALGWLLLSSFWDRNPGGQKSTAEEVAAVLRLNQRLIRRIQEYAGLVAFAGYVDYDVHPQPSKELEAYYGAANAAKLRRIKSKYDPQGIFN